MLRPTEVPAPASESETSLRRGQTRRLLIAAAREVFVEHGIRDAPVELICQRAGFSRGAFYSNFATKEELFLALLREETRKRVERVRTALDDPDTTGLDEGLDEPTFREKIHQVYELCAEPLVADQSWYMLLNEFKTRLMYQPTLAAHVNAELARLIEELGQMLVEASRRLGMKLVVPPQDAVHAISALAAASIEQASLENLNSVAETSFFANTLPRLLCGMIIPEGQAPGGET